MNKILEQAHKVFDIEVNALNHLRAILSNDFIQAVELISQIPVQGRLIVIGIGKSGHIGAKIAATIASTGTPAFFLHPSELSHGDLGMITDADVCLAISNSGETQELIQVVPHLNKRNIPIICITSRPNSTLARFSAVCLNIDVQEEACIHNLAPTSSTTATLVLGDALAVTVMEQKNFTAKDFSELHPGGSLGKKFITVGNLMISDIESIPIVKTDCDYFGLVKEMDAKQLGFTCVVDSNGQLMSVITDGDLRRFSIQHKELLFEKTAGELIDSKAPYQYAHTGDLAIEAVERMKKSKILCLPILSEDNHSFIGVITLQAILIAGIS